jgi:S-formylglutathione hydrolase FrmB
VSNPNLIWKYRLHQGYDHGYFFVQTFIEDHFLFHKKCWADQTSSSDTIWTF